MGSHARASARHRRVAANLAASSNGIRAAPYAPALICAARVRRSAPSVRPHAQQHGSEERTRFAQLYRQA